MFFIRAIEEFVRRCPQHANFKRPVDSHAGLHIAAIKNRFDVVSFLAQMVFEWGGGGGGGGGVLCMYNTS